MNSTGMLLSAQTGAAFSRVALKGNSRAGRVWPAVKRLPQAARVSLSAVLGKQTLEAANPENQAARRGAVVPCSSGVCPIGR